MISIKNYLCYAYYKICQKKASDLFLFFFCVFCDSWQHDHYVVLSWMKNYVRHYLSITKKSRSDYEREEIKLLNAGCFFDHID